MFRQAIHFAPGAIPIWLPRPVIANCCACGVTTVAVVVAGERRIVAARVVHVVMDGIMPVVIVIGVLSVPATVVRLQRIMRPTHASVGAPHNNVLSRKTQCPELAVRGCN